MAIFGVSSIRILGSPHQIIYSTVVTDVVLNITPRSQDQRFDINGQLYPSNGLVISDVTVQILVDAIKCGSAVTNSRGEFSLTGLLPGEYKIILSDDHSEIQIAPIHLGA